ncbi:serine beta-lactamase-like protein LACTB, mitochondrial [Paramacrobiotus metropolitanus]|uniref:serine beta-lactamase-like protein LACTB, mitochondrial n=1 Tax=Paramacrobiotus metropolitanus TaxID=2943436 RepID=UPI002445C08B|nr:serine beta-lactamase-like protein LACTB, mitochondrial [Paramacrobiotus metropolitanus]
MSSFATKSLTTAATAFAAYSLVSRMQKKKILNADTAFVRNYDVSDFAVARLHLVNNFWLPDPHSPPMVAAPAPPPPFPHLLGPNVMNNNLDTNVSLVDATPVTDYSEDEMDWVGIGPSAVGAVGSVLFHHGYNRKLSLQEAVRRSRGLLQRHREEIGDPGMVVGVSIDGRVVWTEGLGYADFENRVPCHAQTVMRIASIGKAVSMTIIAKLWEEGKLDLDKPIQEYVPDFPFKEFNGKPVTITCRQLVSHLGGIRHYSKIKKPDATTDDTASLLKNEKDIPVKQPVLARYNEFEEKEYYIKEHYKTINESLNIFKDDPLLNEPGEEYLYTTHGWTLLCAVIEAVTKRKITDCLKDLFRDLDMQNTYLDEHEPIVYYRSRNYRRDKSGRLQNAPYVDNSYKWAGGGLLSTVTDLLKFAHVLIYSFQWKEGLPVGYLKPATLQNMWTLVDKTKKNQYAEGGYGMGWCVVPEKRFGAWCFRQPHVAYHTGGAIGASSVLTIIPRERKDEEGHEAPPRGIAVTLIANLERAALYRKSVEVAQLFDQVDVSSL